MRMITDAPGKARGDDRSVAAPQRNIPIPDDLWAAIQKQAKAKGVSASAYIREATLARLFFEHGVAGDRRIIRALGIAQRELRRR